MLELAVIYPAYLPGKGVLNAVAGRGKHLVNMRAYAADLRDADSRQSVAHNQR